MPNSTYYLRVEGSVAYTIDPLQLREQLTYLATALDRGQCRLLCYCLLPQEMHLIVQTGNSPLSDFFDALGTELRKLRGGTYFVRRMHQIWIDPMRYLIPLVRQIHRLPETVDSLQRWENYQASSHQAYLHAATQSLVDCSVLLQLLRTASGENVLQGYEAAMAQEFPRILHLEYGNHCRLQALVAEDDITIDQREWRHEASLPLSSSKRQRIAAHAFHA